MSLRIAHINKKKIKQEADSGVIELARILREKHAQREQKKLKSKLNNQKP